MKCGTTRIQKKQTLDMESLLSRYRSAHRLGMWNRDQRTFARLLKRLGKWSVWFFFTDNWPIYRQEISHNDLIQGKRGTVRIERNNA